MPAFPGDHEAIPLGEREGREGVQKGKSSQVNTLHTNTKLAPPPQRWQGETLLEYVKTISSKGWDSHVPANNGIF